MMSRLVLWMIVVALCKLVTSCARNGMMAMKPGGYHVMFMGLKGPLKEGDSFPLSLVFEKAGEIGVMVTVMKAGAMGSMKMKHAD